MTNRHRRAMFESLEARSLLSTFIVDTVIDESDGNFDAGDFSLREAVERANDQAGDDTITFAPTLAGGTIALGGTALRITSSLSISGLGTDQLTISANNASRVFNIDDEGPTTSNVAISGLTLSKGSGAGGGAVANSESLTLTGVRITDSTTTLNGAGLFNQASVVVNACTFDHNSAVGSGGGINNASGASLNIVNSTFSDNTAQGDGGAVWNDGTAAITDSTFTHNTANTGAGGGGSVYTDIGSTLVMNGGKVSESSAFKGGGVLVNGTLTLFGVWVTANHAFAGGGGVASFEGGSITLEGTTVSGNISDESGGGVAARGPTTIRNSTISGNATRDSGGGIQLVGGNATISNSTIFSNGDTIGPGAGILVQNGVLTLNSTIVAFNAFGNPVGFSEISLSSGGSIAPASANNLFGDAASSGGMVNGVNGNIVGADPRLGPLAKQGGSTPSQALMAGSPAIDKGSNPLSLTTDQRGYARVGGTTPDIGAYETRAYSTDAGPGRLVVGTADSANVHRVATVNRDGAVIVFETGWTAVNLQEQTGAPLATGDAVIWVDPKDGLTYVAAPSTAGLILFTRAANGSWSYRNLTTETTAPASPTGNLTQFTSKGNIVVLAGTAGDGKLVSFQQNGAAAAAGGPAFEFVDVSAQIAANGGTTPQLSNLISWVTDWDAWNLAGIDANGDIQAVWFPHSGSTTTNWRLDNLSDQTNAPPLTGQLAVTLTPWGGMSLTGLDASGNVVATWWVPGFTAWANNNLTADLSAAPLASGNISGFTTPWGGQSYAGLTQDGTVTVYWWVPGMEKWSVDPLLPPSVPASQRPAGQLTSSSSAAGTLDVYGTSPTGDALRMWWAPGQAAWAVDDLTVAGVKT